LQFDCHLFDLAVEFERHRNVDATSCLLGQ
jgi:hypothetical protein